VNVVAPMAIADKPFLRSCWVKGRQAGKIMLESENQILVMTFDRADRVRSFRPEIEQVSQMFNVQVYRI
jgi:hypothetical protein